MTTPPTTISERLFQLHFKLFGAPLLACVLKGIWDGYFINNTRVADTQEMESTNMDETKKSLPVAKPGTLAKDVVAWPTLALMVVCITTWSSAWYMRIKLGYSAKVTLPISVISSYWSFTVLHEAVHGAISYKYKWLNPLLGTIGGIPLMSPAPDGTSLDPDEWAGRGPWPILPLRWATVLHRYAWWFSKFMTARAYNPNTPQRVLDADSYVRRITAIQLVVTMFILRKLAKWDARTLSVCWLLPHTIATTWLMYFFDYIPHRPHVIPYKQDPYKSTNATTFGISDKVNEWWFSFLCLSQNMHIVHHIWPSMPFYKYGELWDAHEEELKSNGVRVVPLFVTEAMADVFDELKGR